MNTHTPGPWRVALNDGSVAIKSSEAAPRTIAQLNRPFPHLLDDAENQANARLIASAPDLLAALEAMLFATAKADGQIAKEARKIAVSAIAAAKGGKL